MFVGASFGPTPVVFIGNELCTVLSANNSVIFALSAEGTGSTNQAYVCADTSLDQCSATKLNFAFDAPALTGVTPLNGASSSVLLERLGDLAP